MFRNFSKTVVLKGLPGSTTLEMLKGRLLEYGNITSMQYVHFSKENKNCIVSVSFDELDSALAIKDELNQSTQLYGKRITVQFYKPPKKSSEYFYR